MSHTAYANIVTRLYPTAKVTRVVRLVGGVSADVHRIDVQLPDHSEASLVLRAHRASHSGHAADLEYQLLQTLHQRGLLVPKPLLFDLSGALLENPFLVIEFVEGSSEIPAAQQNHYITRMADALANIHAVPTVGLPTLPARTDPLPELFDFLPEGHEWEDLVSYLRTRSDTSYRDTPMLLHGDFWPENLLWRNGSIASILDWEDAALGDPLSDVAACRLELRYKFGTEGMDTFTKAYAKHRDLDQDRLALWQIYVAAAAQRFMGEWGLDSKLESHMRSEALMTIREAADSLLG